MCDIIGLILPLIRRSSDEISCKTVAVLLHFFSLALCTWPVIIACDYYKIVGCRDFLERSNISYLRYCAVSFGMSFIVTLICVTIDILSFRSLIRYGYQDYFWVFPFHTRSAVYMVPFVVMNLGSFVLVFIVTIETKREKRKNHSMLAKKHQLIYSKILFGTAELIGLIQIPNAEQKDQSEVIFNVIFGLLYNFLRSTRGIFMFVLFACNKIFEKYKERIQTLSTVN